MIWVDGVQACQQRDAAYDGPDVETEEDRADRDETTAMMAEMIDIIDKVR